MRILNLTQHAATDDQLDAGVVDMADWKAYLLRAYLSFDSVPTRELVEERAMKIAALAVVESERPLAAMIGGAPWLMAPLERALRDRDIPALYAFSLRESVEETLPDGSVRKINVFRHAGFIDAV